MSDCESENYIKFKQECIPVGCVPTTAVAATRCQYQGEESAYTGGSE